MNNHYHWTCHKILGSTIKVYDIPKDKTFCLCPCFSPPCIVEKARVFCSYLEGRVFATTLTLVLHHILSALGNSFSACIHVFSIVSNSIILWYAFYGFHWLDVYTNVSTNSTAEARSLYKYLDYSVKIPIGEKMHLLIFSLFRCEHAGQRGSGLSVKKIYNWCETVCYQIFQWKR